MPNILAKKIGPFPVAVYAGAGVVAIGLGLYLRKKSTATAEGLPPREDLGFSLGEDFPFTFEAPPEQPPTIIIQPPLIPPVVPGPDDPPDTPPDGRQRDTLEEMLFQWNKQKAKFGWRTSLKTQQRIAVMNKFLRHYNKNRPGGETWTWQELKAAPGPL